MARDERRPLDRGTPKELKRGLEKYTYATQGNFDHLSGQAREFARQFNLLASDVATLYDFFGLDQFDEAPEIGGEGGISSLVAHNELDDLTVGDPHTQYRLEADNHTHASSGLQGGTIDHGVLTGLGDDDHTQYRLESADHTHQSTGLQAGTLDHGLALTGLGDDDHPQYAALAQNEVITGTWTFEDDVTIDSSTLFMTTSELESEQPADTDRVLSAFVTADTQFRFILAADGDMLWGSGSAGGDTNLYRAGANQLKTDDDFLVSTNTRLYADGTLAGHFFVSYDLTGPYIDIGDANNTVAAINRTDASYVPLTVRGMAAQSGNLQNWQDSTPTTLSYVNAAGAFVGAVASASFIKVGSATSTASYEAYVSGDGNQRWMVRANGETEWGDGTAARDVNLYRSAANVLKTDDKLITVVGLGVGNSAAATTPGTVTDKIEVFDASGVSLGFLAVYDAIT